MREIAFAVLMALLASGDPDEPCSDPPPELDLQEALAEHHRLRGEDRGKMERIVGEQLPVIRCLASSRAGDEERLQDDRLHEDRLHEDWLHLGVHLGWLLRHLERPEEARGVFAWVEDLDPDGRWGRRAADQLYILEELRPGMPAPAFDGRALSGETLSKEDLLGRVVLLDFWATWCAPCVADLAKLKDLQRRFGDDGLAVVGVALDEEREPLERMTAEKGVSWPQLWDGEGTEGEIPRLFAVGGPAIFYLLDRRGRIAAGPLGSDGLETAVTAAVEAPERPVP